MSHFNVMMKKDRTYTLILVPYTRKFLPVKNFTNGLCFVLREKLISPIVRVTLPEVVNFTLGENFRRVKFSHGENFHVYGMKIT